MRQKPSAVYKETARSPAPPEVGPSKPPGPSKPLANICCCCSPDTPLTLALACRSCWTSAAPAARSRVALPDFGARGVCRGARARRRWSSNAPTQRRLPGGFRRLRPFAAWISAPKRRRSAASCGSLSVAARRQRLCAGLAARTEPARWRRQRPPWSSDSQEQRPERRNVPTAGYVRGSVGWEHITGLCKIRRKIRLTGFIVVVARRYGRRYGRILFLSSD